MARALPSIDLSVIIPTYQRPGKIAACLRTLARQSLEPERYEVLVGLDGPDPRTAEVCERAWSQAGGARGGLRVEPCERIGLAAVRNRLIGLARGRILLSLNDDVLAEPALCQVHAEEGIRRLATGSGGGGATIVGDSPWVAPSPEQDTLLDRLIRETSMIFFYDQMTGPARGDPGHDWGFRHAFGLNVSYPTELVRQAGGYAVFPEKYGYEDVEIAWRLRERFGMPVLFRPAARLWHDHRYTAQEYLRREVKLGFAAAGFARAAPACAAELFRRNILDDSERVYCREFIERERAGAMRMAATFEELGRVPAAVIDGDQSTLLLRGLYEQHLLLKRYAFRRGLLGSLCGEDIKEVELFGPVNDIGPESASQAESLRINAVAG